MFMNQHANAMELVNPSLVQAVGHLGLALGLGWNLGLLHMLWSGIQAREAVNPHGMLFWLLILVLKSQIKLHKCIEDLCSFHFCSCSVGQSMFHGHAQHQCKENIWKYVPLEAAWEDGRRGTWTFVNNRPDTQNRQRPSVKPEMMLPTPATDAGVSIVLF